MKITRKLLETLAPKAEEYFAWDDTMPGFGVRIAPTGRRVYVLRFRTLSGIQRKMNIGRCDVLTPDQARDQAREHLAAVARGEDPAVERHSRRSSATIADLAALHTEDRAGKIKRSSATNYDIMWRRHILPLIGARRVADFDDDAAAMLHTALGKVSHINANRCITLLHGAFELAERKKMRARRSNPFVDVQLFPEHKRQMILNADQRARLFAALDAYDHPIWAVPYLVRLLILTGCRREEWAMAKWDWINWENHTLNLPDSKTGPKAVPLSAAVVSLLRDIRDIGERKPGGKVWICPNMYGTNGLASFVTNWDWIRNRAGLPGLRLHDLRHTMGSVSHQAGLSMREVADLLGHASTRTTERYVSSVSEERRQIVNRAAAAILAR